MRNCKTKYTVAPEYCSNSKIIKVEAKLNISLFTHVLLRERRAPRQGTIDCRSQDENTIYKN